MSLCERVDVETDVFGVSAVPVPAKLVWECPDIDETVDLAGTASD